VLINASNGRRLSDGVEQPTALASDPFPYLQPPNPVLPDQLPLIDFAHRVGPVAGAH
jgi:hypothetical protein